MLPEANQKQGVCTASAGNHALALSYHGQELGTKIIEKKNILKNPKRHNINKI